MFIVNAPLGFFRAPKGKSQPWGRLSHAAGGEQLCFRALTPCHYNESLRTQGVVLLTAALFPRDHPNSNVPHPHPTAGKLQCHKAEPPARTTASKQGHRQQDGGGEMDLLGGQHELAAACCMALLTAACLCSSSGWQLACACMLEAKSFLNSAFHPLPSLVMYFRDKITLALSLMYRIAKLHCGEMDLGMLEPVGQWFAGSTASGHLLGTSLGPQRLRVHGTALGTLHLGYRACPGLMVRHQQARCVLVAPICSALSAGVFPACPRVSGCPLHCCCPPVAAMHHG